ncbi:hypothetical protein EDC94DRAFT_589666 [Helicostylum pulchrum]|nr:hypothetical protein EDC94DRAFT_589666 [Helicostylum pulchrum]
MSNNKFLVGNKSTQLSTPVTKRVKDSQTAEAEQRYRGVELPEEVYTELESYNQHELQKALQKFKRTIPKYNNEEWNTPETTNPNFISQLKQWKVDSLQLVNQIYKLTENMRVQARAATEIFEQLCPNLFSRVDISSTGSRKWVELVPCGRPLLTPATFSLFLCIFRITIYYSRLGTCERKLQLLSDMTVNC